MHKQVEIALDPVFDPQRQIASKFFWMPSG
jgi:hypothetical protein